MKCAINLKDLTIADEQAEQFAFSIFKDIDEYINQNETEFMSWLVGIDVETLNKAVVTTNEKSIVIPKNTNIYKLCKYKI